MPDAQVKMLALYSLVGCVAPQVPCCEGCCCTCGTDFPLWCECHEEARSGASQPATAPAPGTAGADADELTPRGELSRTVTPETHR